MSPTYPRAADEALMRCRRPRQRRHLVARARSRSGNRGLIDFALAEIARKALLPAARRRLAHES